jgi:PAS domain S-box-containing protein
MTNGNIDDLEDLYGSLVRTAESQADGLRRFEALAESSPDAVVVIDAKGIILFANRRFFHVFGYSSRKSDDLLGESVEKIMPARYRDSHRGGLRRYLSTGASNLIGRIVKVTGLKVDGTEIPVELSIGHWQTESGEHFFSGVIRDIGPRIALDELLDKLVSERNPDAVI